MSRALALVLAWDGAWEKYSTGMHQDMYPAGAIPGLLLAIASGLLDLDKWVEQHAKESNYLESLERRLVNLALRQAAQIGWLSNVTLPQGDHPHCNCAGLYNILFAKVMGGLSQERVAELLKHHPGPDLSFWTITMQGRVILRDVGRTESLLPREAS